MPTTTRTVKVIVINPGEEVGRVRQLPLDFRAFGELVGGFIESLTLSSELTAYVNEEGKMQGLPVNVLADILVRAELSRIGRRLTPGDQIVGPLILTGPPDREGYETDVPVDYVKAMGLRVEEDV